MTEFSMLPWATGSTGDGISPYTQAQSNDFFRYADVRNPANEGVILGSLGESNPLQCQVSGSNINVNPGAAVCYGRYYNSALNSLTPSVPVVATTGGRIVLRCDWTAQTIRLVVLQNTDGVGSAPALTQTFGTTWEISLCSYTITTGGTITITSDDRQYRLSTFLVDTDAIEDLAISSGKIASSAVTTSKIANLNVTLAKLANNSVDDTKVGDRVAQFYRRQGGSSSNWDTVGSSNYTPGAVRVQFGRNQLVVGGLTTDTKNVTFPVAFSNAPVLIATPTFKHNDADIEEFYTYNISSTGFTYYVQNTSVGAFSFDISWLAIGPE
jgi:hypothetical protein